MSHVTGYVISDWFKTQVFCRGLVLGAEVDGTVKVKLVDFGEERTVAVNRFAFSKIFILENFNLEN